MYMRSEGSSWKRRTVIMASSSAGVVPRLANRIQLDAQLDEQRQREYEALEKEFQWLLEYEYTQKVETIDKCIQDCLKKFSTVLQPTGGADNRPILLSSPRQGDGVYCLAAVSGDKILKAEITLKLPGRGSKALKTFIKEHAAVKLRQIQDSANFFQLARDKFAVVRQSGESLRTPDEIHQSFSGLCSSLRAAEEMLIVPQLPNVQDLYTAENRSHMKPELPEDLALHFHISSVYLVLTVLIVAPSAKRPSSGQSQRSSGASCDSDTQWIGATFEYGSNVYEVVNQLQVKSKVPWLADVLKLLQEAQELSQDLIDKVTLFRSMGLTRK